MGLESADFISELVPSNPLDTDDPTQGAAHLRVTKNALQGSFPNINAQVDCAPEDLNQLTGLALSELMPVGSVLMWTTPNIPNGWIECNGAIINAGFIALIALVGTNTPDLSNTFIRGSGVGRAPLTTQAENVGAHSHSTNSKNDDPSSGSNILNRGTVEGSGLPEHEIATTVNPTGENIPANTALMFIIKT